MRHCGTDVLIGTHTLSTSPTKSFIISVPSRSSQDIVTIFSLTSVTSGAPITLGDVTIVTNGKPSVSQSACDACATTACSSAMRRLLAELLLMQSGVRARNLEVLYAGDYNASE